MAQRIKGISTELEGQGRSEDSAPLVTLIAPGSNAVELALELVAGCPDFRYQLFSPSVSVIQRDLLRRQGIRFTTDLEFALWHCSTPHAALSFGLLPHPNHLAGAVLTSLLQDGGIPVFDVQHGLFQWGISFRDDSVEQGFGNEVGVGVSVPIQTLADHQLCWWGEGALGYPRFRGEMPSEDRGYALIATNLNWHIYSPEERERCVSLILQTIRSNPKQRFVWKPHPAEFNPKLTNLGMALEDHQLPNLEVITHIGAPDDMLSELVRSCSFGIATVGTALLDFEMFRKPCVTFRSTAVEHLLHALKSAAVFSDKADLDKMLAAPAMAVPLVTGRLQKFSPEVLRERIPQQRVCQAHALDAILRKCELARNLLPKT